MADIIGRIGGTYKHPVVDEIPDELRPEEVVYVKGSGLWIGASENAFPGLDEGTPWPLKGYKELRGFIDLKTEGDDVIRVKLNEISNDISVSSTSLRTDIFFLDTDATQVNDMIGIINSVSFQAPGSGTRYFLSSHKEVNDRFFMDQGGNLMCQICVIDSNFNRVRVDVDKNNVELLIRLYAPQPE